MGFTYAVGKSMIMPEISTDTKCIVCWGTNPYHSKIRAYPTILNAKKAGAKLIVIDPRKTETAKKADIHARIRPGTDLALALGLLNVIISKNLYDKDFVERWTVGFDELAELAKDYRPSKVEEITRVPAEVVMSIAKIAIILFLVLTNIF